MLKNENKRNIFILTNISNVSEQHSRNFSRRSDILRNANVGGIVDFKFYNSKNI